MKKNITYIFDGILEKSNGIVKDYVFYCSSSFIEKPKEYKGIKIIYSDLIEKDIVYYSQIINLKHYEQMKKTATKWFEEQLYEFETLSESLPTKLYEFLSIAKEMEKNNITEAFKDGFLSSEKSENYFIENFNS